jgi:hypothetical protein
MSEGEARTRKDKPYWAPFVVALVMFFVLVAFYIDPTLLDFSKYGLDFDMFMNIGYLIIVIMLCLMFIWKITLSTEVAPDEVVVEKVAIEKEEEPSEEEYYEEEAPPEEKAKVRPKRVVVEPEEEEIIDIDEEEEALEITDLPRMIEYPKKDPGGVYSDTLVRVDENLILNLRTLLGKVCHNCEELEDCKRRVSGKLDDDVFLYNFECKPGLKKELQRARKKREAAKAKAAKEQVEEKAEGAKEKKTSTATAKKKASSGGKKKATSGGKKKASSKGKKRTAGKK